MRQPLRDVQLTFDRGVLQILCRVVTQIRSQMFQRVVVRIHGPHDLIQRLEQITRCQRDGIQFARHSFLTLQFTFRPLTHVGYLGQLRADLVVHVLRDPHPLTFERLLLSQNSEATAQAAV